MPADSIVVLASGSFDQIDEDTEQFLKTARGLGDTLMVAVTEGKIPINSKINQLETRGYIAIAAKNNSVLASVRALKPSIFAAQRCMPDVEAAVRSYGGLVTRFEKQENSVRNLVRS